MSVCGYHLIVEIGSVEGSCERDWLWYTQDLLAFLEDAAGCRGGEAEQRHFGELPLQDAQQLIIYGEDNEILLHTLNFFINLLFDIKNLP